MACKYKFTYFNACAKGESTRMLFKLADQPFEDVRIEFSEWPKIKPTTRMGFLPYLEFDGKILCQTNAINRYLAEEFGFCGKTAYDKARASMIADSLEDVFHAIRPVIGATLTGVEVKEERRQKVYDGTFQPYLQKLQQILEENDDGNGYFVGSELTWADVVCVVMLNLFGSSKAMANDTFWEDFPKLKALKARVESEPKIAQWIKERPDTEF